MKDAVKYLEKLVSAAKVTQCEWKCVSAWQAKDEQVQVQQVQKKFVDRLKKYTADLARDLKAKWEVNVHPQLVMKIQEQIAGEKVEESESDDGGGDDKKKKDKKDKKDKKEKVKKEKVIAKNEKKEKATEAATKKDKVMKKEKK